MRRKAFDGNLDFGVRLATVNSSSSVMAMDSAIFGVTKGHGSTLKVCRSSVYLILPFKLDRDLRGKSKLLGNEKSKIAATTGLLRRAQQSPNNGGFLLGTYINHVIVLAFWDKQTVSNRSNDQVNREDASLQLLRLLAPQLRQLQKKTVRHRKGRSVFGLVHHFLSTVAAMSNGKSASNLGNTNR